MKKILTVAALLLLVVCMTFVLGSCGGVSVDKAEDDPAAIISEALELGCSGFFSVDEKADRIIEEAVNSGAVTFALEGNEVFESIFGRAFSDAELKAIVYSNTKNNKYAIEIDSTISDEDIKGILFIDKDKVVLQSKTFLGSKNAYSFSPAIFAQKYEDSDLENLLALDKYGDEQLVKIFEDLRDAYARAFEDNAEKNKELTRALYEALDYEVAEQRYDGTPVIVVTLKVNNNTLEDLFDAFADAADLKGDLRDEYEDAIEEALEEINENMNLDCEIKIAIDKNNGKLYKATADLLMTPTDEDYDDQSISAKVDFTISDDKLELGAKFVADVDDKYEYEFKLTGDKKVDGDKVEYDFALDAKGEFGGEDIDGTVLSASFEYDKKSGDFELSIEGDEDIADFDASIEGNMKVEGKAVTVAIEEIGANSVSVKIGLSVKYEKGVALPATPEAKEFVELSEDELEDLANDIKEDSIFADMFGYGY